MNKKHFTKTTSTLLLTIFLTLNFSQNVSAVFNANTYAYQKYVSINRNSQKASPYIQQLETEVNSIITSPQRLQPYYQEIGIVGGLFFWGYPGEEFLTLCQAIPYLSPTLQTQTINYINSQYTSYSPNSYAYYPQAATIFDLSKTPRRERYPLPLPSNSDQNVWPPVTVPLGSLYVLSSCADSTNNWNYITTNWNSINSIYTNFTQSNSSIKTHQQLLGVIGYIRLATKTNNTQNINNALALMNSSAASLADLKTIFNNFNSTNDPTLKLQTQPTHDWTIPFFFASRGNRAVITLYGHELGRFFKSESNTITHQIFDTINSNAPQWFMFKSHYPGYGGADASGTNTWQGQDVAWLFNSGYGENNMFTPDIPWSIFMIKAHVYNPTTEELASYLDVPYTAKGDLYHIQKLVAVIESTGTECWENIQTPTQECIDSSTTPNPSTLTPSPTSTPLSRPCPLLGDTNLCDGIINALDFTYLSSKFGTNDPKADLKQDGIINVLDYSILSANFGKTS